MSELKSTEMEVLQESMPSDGIEDVPALRKTVTAVPRAGTAIKNRPGLIYSASHSYNDREASEKGVIEGISINLEGNMRITGAYIYPIVSGPEMKIFIHWLITGSRGRDILIPDVNVGYSRWDDSTCCVLRSGLQ